jgi:hypothetical protein
VESGQEILDEKSQRKRQCVRQLSCYDIEMHAKNWSGC